MRTGSNRRPGRQLMVDNQRDFTWLIGQGVSISAACRKLGIDRKTGHWWKNGSTIIRGRVVRTVAPVIGQRVPRVESGHFLCEEERMTIADGVHSGRSAHSIAL